MAGLERNMVSSGRKCQRGLSFSGEGELSVRVRVKSVGEEVGEVEAGSVCCSFASMLLGTEVVPRSMAPGMAPGVAPETGVGVRPADCWARRSWATWAQLVWVGLSGRTAAWA